MIIKYNNKNASLFRQFYLLKNLHYTSLSPEQIKMLSQTFHLIEIFKIQISEHTTLFQNTISILLQTIIQPQPFIWSYIKRSICLSLVDTQFHNFSTLTVAEIPLQHYEFRQIGLNKRSSKETTHERVNNFGIFTPSGPNRVQIPLEDRLVL